MRTLVLFLVSLIYFPFVYAKIENPAKIGIGTWEVDSKGTSLKHLESLKFGWYYNWRTDRIWAPGLPKRTVPFVPMIWDETKMNSSLPSGSQTLLTFNEPDHRDQANMSVSQALNLWPKLMSKKRRLSSPATATGNAIGARSWLGQFMAGAQKKAYRVDFIALHYYSSDKSVAAFRAYLEAVHAAYKRPIWVTEWALVDWNRPSRFSETDIADFAAQSLEMLDDLPYVERHAYFSAYSYSNYGSIRTELFDSQLRLTPVGQVFARALAGK